MKTFLTGSLGVAALLTSATALAQPAPNPAVEKASAPARRNFFNSDQKRSDVPAHVDRTFKQLDLNHDGIITRDELAASKAQFDERMDKSAPKRAAKLFDRLDTNHDGKIARAEIAARRAARSTAHGKAPKAGSRAPGSALFERADSNKDGTITRPEFDAAVAGGKIKLRHANMRGSAIARLFDAADVNRDGRVSLQEAQQAALQHFDAADVNHDGVLTPNERRQASSRTRTKKRG